MANINKYKNRMTSPVGATQIDPKTRKPIKTTTKTPKKGK